MTALRSLLFNALFYAVLAVLMVLGLPALLFGRQGVFFMARLWASTSIWLLARLCGLHVEYRGLENIPQGGYIIASKHQSFLESLALLKYAPDFSYILKRELVFIPVFGLYLLAGRQIAIDRGSGRGALASMIRKARVVIADKRQIFIYPEGTRRAPGAPPQYKFGVAALYEATAAPILPVAINTGLYWGRRGFLRRPGTAIIEYLPAIAPGLAREQAASLLENQVEGACARLNAEAVAANPALAIVLAQGLESKDANPQ